MTMAGRWRNAALYWTWRDQHRSQMRNKLALGKGVAPMHSFVESVQPAMIVAVAARAEQSLTTMFTLLGRIGSTRFRSDRCPRP